MRASPYYECGDFSCSASARTHVTNGLTPIEDPPALGYSYCYPGCANNFPFYEPVTASPQTQCIHFSGTPTSPGPCETFLEDGEATLNFFDQPYDLCLPGPLGLPGAQFLLNPS